MFKIENLYHGTNKKFYKFDDKFLGTALGTGYIKAHWFACDGRNPRKSSKQYAEKLNMKNPYIYEVTIFYKMESIVNSDDKISLTLSDDNIKILEEKCLNFKDSMTFQELINENEKFIWEILISIDIIVIRNWLPDNGLCKEYIAVLTTSKSDLCFITINNKP